MVFVLLLFGLPIFYLPKEVEGWDFYNEILGDEYYLEEIRPHIDKWLGGSLRMFVRDVFEKSGYRDNENTVLHIRAELPIGHTLEQMDDIIQKVEAYLSGIDGLDKFVTNVHSGQNAQIAIYFQPAYETSSLPYTLKNRIIARSLDWGGVEWDVYGVGKGFSNSSVADIPHFRVEMKGYNYDELEKQAVVLAEKLLVHKRVQAVNTSEVQNYGDKKTDELVLGFENRNITSGNISIGRIIQSMKKRSLPTSPDMYLHIHNQLTPVVVIDQKAETFSGHDLMYDPIYSRKEEGIRTAKIAAIGTIQLEPTVNTIYKKNRLYIRQLAFDYFGSQHFGDKYLDEKLAEMINEMPPGYSVEKRSFNWNLEKLKRQYSLLVLLIVAIYFICAILFENLKLPFVVISTIPVSFIGLFLVFALFDFYFDQGGYAAFLLLGGLVVNASIFVLSDYKNLGHIPDPNKRLIRALSGKARPIMLTVLSTICGLIPFLIEGEDEVFWFSLAIGTIGGLVFSLFSIFCFLPVVMWKRKNGIS